MNASYNDADRLADSPTPADLTDALRDLGDLRLALYRAVSHDRLIGRAPLRRWARLADRAAEKLIDRLQALAARTGDSANGNCTAAHASNGDGAGAHAGNGNGSTHAGNGATVRANSGNDTTLPLFPSA